MGNNLKEARMSSGMTQREVSDAVGISLSGYQKIEQGQRRASGDLVAKIAGVIGVSTDVILGSQFAGKTTMSLSPSEVRLIETSRSLNPIGVDALLAYADRCKASAALTEPLDDVSE